MNLPTAVLANNDENESDVLSLYANPVDSQSGLIEHDGFQKLNAMRDLLVEYNTTLKHMQAMYDAVMRNRHDEAWRMFCDSCDNSIKYTLAVENLFCIERARCALDEKYWQKLLDLTGVKPFMPTERYDDWNEGLRAWRKSSESNFEKLKPVPFNEESIFSTAFALNEEKKDYFAQMVHGVFEKLSALHKTNRAQGFSNKLIIASCLPSRDNRRSYDYLNYFNDLRKVIGLMYGRSGAEDVNSAAVKEYMMSNPGEWVSIDNDSLKVKGFINGNVHILIEEETCDNLNLVLSHLMPGCIPLDRRYTTGHNSARTVKTNEYRSQLISFSAVNSLISYATDHLNAGKHLSPGPHTFILRDNQSVSEKKELVNIWESLGAVRRYREVYDIDFSPVEAFKLLALHGSIPDRYTHQFYATVGELQKRAIDECMVASGMRLLEPNIGLGALLKGLPEGVDVTGFDIHPAAVAITGLRWNVTLNDFLLVKPENTGLFERILMNPPFSDSRWIAHFQHAMRFLKPGGRLIAILPGSAKEHLLTREAGPGYDINILGCYDNAFEGTAESIKLFSVDAHE
ncbi:DUF4942 domain-containing protein [Citrobacter freundii]|uniref:DUF4942 domain-containing protein n=2 Tax=Citrobacter freundii TaxID=546 RepID=UPI00101EC60B|nr:DUF4942 domain-containing protein [Citrobacter freundii]MBD5667345.1 DUF4942 domain-containing protein [Citrobacter freundii]MBD5696907.1 DUF4942 domain-containing protein [Citrobacter freundii]RZA75749.1 DUF4942 domain-containing protein [Citrobacter freundii]